MTQARAPSPEQAHDLQQRLGGALWRDVPLAPLTTFNVGGNAAWFLEAHDTEELANAITIARELAIDHFLLGCGANILFGDRGYPGLVIHNRADEIDIDGQRLHAGSGAIMYPNVIDTAVSAGLSGLEHYVGIPSTVGGALWQNLHFLSPPPERERTMFIAEVFESAEILSAEGERQRVEHDYFEFGYDQSILHERSDIVLEATFKLAQADAAAMHEVMTANLDWRAQRHPPLTTEPSAGSIFRKIEGVGAGRLIDECGLKGFHFGGAQFSPRHANIIINNGEATAAHICSLIMHAQRTVYQQTGHWLTPEIGFVGEFAPVKKIKTQSE